MVLKYKLKLFLLIAGDLALMALAYYGAYFIRFGSEASVLLSKRPAGELVFVLILLMNSYLFEVYNLEKHCGSREILVNSTIAITSDFIMLTCIFFVFPDLMVGRGLLAILLLLFFIMQYAWHIVYVLGVKHPFMTENLLVLGTGATAGDIGGVIGETASRFHHRLAGYVECAETAEPQQVPQEMIVGVGADLQEIVRRTRASAVVVALPEKRGMAFLRNQLLNCKFQGISIYDSPTFYEEVTGKLMLSHGNIGDELIFSTGFRFGSNLGSMKRVFDVFLAVIVSLLVLPFFPLFAMLVKLDSPGPIFYSQERVGLMGKTFILYKFRSMRQNAERFTGAVWAQENDPRLSAIGRFLRKWRIDELPQLFNVLKGEMSFFGPRPERLEFVEKLTAVFPFYPKRHFVKPGITGWAQIRYPYGASMEDAYQKLCYDLYYIKNLSPWLDLLIIFETIKVVIFGRGR